MNILRKLRLIIIYCFFLSGCITMIDEFEHDNNIFVNLSDNNYSVKFDQFLDSNTIPFYAPEEYQSWEALIDSNNIHLNYKKTFNYNEKPPSLFQMLKMQD